MSNVTLPNPTTPLAFLPPTLARHLEICRYVWAAALGAWLWDVATCLQEEYRMIVRSRFRKLSDVVYVLARITTGGFAMTAFCFVASPVNNCHTLAKVIGSFAALALPLNCLLFIFRVRAVFNQNRYVVGFFVVLWLAIFGSSMVAPFSVDGLHIGTTKYCIPTKVPADVSIGMTISAVHDTLVYLSITVRLTTFSLASTWSARIKMFLRGNGLGSMSKIVLQSGQLYYMATVGVNIVAATVILIPSVPPVYRAMFSPLNVILQNAMACKVYRQLKLGLIKDLEMSSVTDETLGSIRFTVYPTQHRNSGRRQGCRPQPRYTSTELDLAISTIPDILSQPNDHSDDEDNPDSAGTAYELDEVKIGEDAV
ncbi:hypothetical protein EUX98_g5735 [Antrodiella citrinella]|uniref:G-protein coupled receptors family 1 profile domain-containing protein n=1 Tax=Antrodiella citrinella TaxID=2447956 RepID=A0A4S4MRP3_9APHY|nr:hypothetical protein EUX98_g5735 [Antrodiella citrinella]